MLRIYRLGDNNTNKYSTNTSAIINMLRCMQNPTFDSLFIPSLELYWLPIQAFYDYQLCVNFKNWIQNGICFLIETSHITKKTITCPTRFTECWDGVADTCWTLYDADGLAHTLPTLIKSFARKNVPMMRLSKQYICLTYVPLPQVMFFINIYRC